MVYVCVSHTLECAGVLMYAHAKARAGPFLCHPAHIALRQGRSLNGSVVLQGGWLACELSGSTCLHP